MEEEIKELMTEIKFHIDQHDPNASISAWYMIFKLQEILDKLHDDRVTELMKQWGFED